MASDRPEQNDAEQDEENREQNDLQEIADLKIQGNTFLIDILHVSKSAPVSLLLDDTKQLKHISVLNDWIVLELVQNFLSFQILSVLISPARHYLCQGHSF